MGFRLYALAFLGGCSFVIPPTTWHPIRDPDRPGSYVCPSYALPAIDGTIGSALALMSVYSLLEADSIEGTMRAAGYKVFGEAEMLVAFPYFVATAYGVLRSGACR